MKKVILILIIFLTTICLNSQTRSVSKSFILKPLGEKVKTIPVINLLNSEFEDESGVQTKDDHITIEGNIIDQNKIISLSINDKEVSISADNNFSFSVGLIKGENIFRLRAENDTGGISGKEIKVYFFPDYSIPIIEFVNKDVDNDSELTVFSDNYVLEGFVKDEYGIQSFTINGNPITRDEDGGFKQELPLVEGRNSILVSVKNLKGKITEKNFSIFSSILPPRIIITSPQIPENSRVLYSGEEITISGKIEDAFPVSSVTINGKNTNVESDGTFTSGMILSDGENKIIINAANTKNKSSQKNFTVITSVVKSTPEITILEPILTETMELTTDDKYVKIKGIINDKYGIKEITVRQNSRVISRDVTNQFEVFVEPAEGVNIINIEAKNGRDIMSTKQFTIIQPVDKTGPVITIIEPQTTRGIQVVHKSEILFVRGEAVDESGVFKVTVNNIMANLLPNGEFSTEITLKLGENRLLVQAFDNKYNATSDTFFVVREMDDLVVGKYYALIIGINSYSGYWKPLANAVNDAKAIAEVLKSHYRIDEVHTLFDTEATEDKITETLYNVGKKMTPEDNLLIYYAGHGYLDAVTNRGYWVPVDAKINLISKYISNSDLRDMIAGMKSKHTLLITDACFAGDIFRGLTTSSIEKDPNDMNKYYRQVYSKPSRIAMTSGGVEPVQDAGKDGHSVFTYYLLKSLKENEKKYMDVEQLYNEFKVAVTNNSNQSPRLDRIKNASDEGGQFIFIKK